MTPRWLAALAICATASGAFAQPASPSACIDAHGAGQELRLQKRLIDARERFRFCAQAGCPDIAVRQCAQWLDEVEKQLPTIIVAVQDASGQDRTDVEVLLDGSALGAAWVGTAREVDPGPHTLTVTPPGGHASSLRFVAREAEKNRVVMIRVAQPGGTPTANGDSVARTMGWIVTGVGVAALATFAALAISAKSDFDELDDECAPGCDPRDVDAGRRKAIFADIALGVGIAGVGVGGFLLVTSWDRGSSAGSGVSVAVGGRF